MQWHCSLNYIFTSIYFVSGRLRSGTTKGARSVYPEECSIGGHRETAFDSEQRLAVFLVRPAGRTYLEVKVLYSPDKGKS